MFDPVRGRDCRALALARWAARSTFTTRTFPHGRLIVCLTSYPPRFATLHLTLKCLLTQTLKPDAVILWIAEQDLPSLPENVTELDGLTISACRDLRSYKKIVPALEAHPDAFIVTADDDVYYEETWLSDLTARHVPGRHDVICHRAHEIRHGASGRPLPYLMWKLNTKTADSDRLFLTGCGGVLYPPGSLHRDTTDESLFTRLCPTNDDIWLFWMARRAGSAIRRVRGRHRMNSWLGSQLQALHHINVVIGANSRQIKAMIDAYGYPPLP